MADQETPVTQESLELVVMKAAKLVTDEILVREERRAKRNAIIFSVLALIGLGGATGAISLQIQSVVQDEVVRAVTEATVDLRREVDTRTSEVVNASIGAVQTTLLQNELLDDFALAANVIQAEGNFRSRPPGVFVETIRQLVADERIAAQVKFLNAFDIIVARFANHDLQQEIDALHDAASHLLSTRVNTALTVLGHYGERLIGSPYEIADQADVVERIDVYLKAAKGNNYPERALLWEIFIEFKDSSYEQTGVLDRLVESIVDLNERDRELFFTQLERYSDPANWLSVETQQGRELARLIAGLRAIYPSLSGNA